MATSNENLLAKLKSNGEVATKPVQRSVQDLLSSDAFKKQIAMALPRHITPDLLLRTVLTELRMNPKLLTCTQESFLGAVMRAAQLGLVAGPLGLAYFIPYENRKRGITEAQLIVGYQGLIELIRRSGSLSTIDAEVVFEGDHFEFEKGTEGKLVHRPDWKSDKRSKETAICVYAFAKLKDGGWQAVVLPVAEVEAIRARSRAGNSGPWVTDWNEMAKKTAIRRLYKFLPKTVEVSEALRQEDDIDFGEVVEVNIPNPEPIETPVVEAITEAQAN